MFSIVDFIVSVIIAFFVFALWVQLYKKLQKIASETIKNNFYAIDIKKIEQSEHFQSMMESNMNQNDMENFKQESLSDLNINTVSEENHNFLEIKNSAATQETSAEQDNLDNINEAIQASVAPITGLLSFVDNDEEDEELESCISSLDLVDIKEETIEEEFESHHISFSDLEMGLNETTEEESHNTSSSDIEFDLNEDIEEEEEEAELESQQTSSSNVTIVTKEEEDISEEYIARTKVAQEMVDTEVTYVKGLETLVNNFKLPLQKEVGTNNEYISMSDIKAIFANVEILSTCHKIFLEEELTPCINSWSEDSCIGNILLKFIKLLNIYTNYVNNYEFALNKLTQCTKERPKFSRFLNKMALEGNDIDSLLILPIQRICRYELLLGQFVKYTPTTHPDKLTLEKALENIKNANVHINEKKRQFESVASLVEFQERFVGNSEPLAIPGRKIIRSDLINGQNITLFNDLIVVSTTNNSTDKLEFTKAIHIGDVRIKDLTSFFRKTKAASTLKLINSNKKTVLTVVFASSALRDNWVSYFNKAKGALPN